MNISSKPWSKQQALITGGASGIGLAIARKLHNLGVRVVLCDLDATKLAAVRDVIGAPIKDLAKTHQLPKTWDQIISWQKPMVTG